LLRCKDIFSYRKIKKEPTILLGLVNPAGFLLTLLGFANPAEFLLTLLGFVNPAEFLLRTVQIKTCHV